MEDHTTLCVCGYDRFRLADDQPCPECGRIEIAKPRIEKIRGLLQGKPSPTAIVSLILSLITLGLSVLLTILILVMVVSLANSSGVGAPIGLILPVYGYLSIILPGVGLTALFAIIPVNDRHWTLAAYSLIITAVAAALPVITFFVGLTFI